MPFDAGSPSESEPARAMETGEAEEQIPEQEENGSGPVSIQSVTLYLYRPDGAVYYPVTSVVEGSPQPGELVDLVVACLELPDVACTVTQEGERITLDLEGAYIDEHLGDDEDEAIVLNSLCATLWENVEGVATIDLRRDGGAYHSPNRTLNDDELYSWPPLRVGGATEAELAELRAAVPYPGMNGNAELSLRYDIVSLDDAGREITRFLARAGDPGVDVDSPEALDDHFVLRQALKNAPWYITYSYGHWEIYDESLKPLAAAVDHETIALVEHVSITIRELFGDVDVPMEDAPPYHWHPAAGVFTPPNASHGNSLQPVVFDYEDLGERYRVEVAYLQEGMGAYFDSDGTAISADELEPAAQRSRRREVVLEKGMDGSLRFFSHRFL